MRGLKRDITDGCRQRQYKIVVIQCPTTYYNILSLYYILDPTTFVNALSFLST